MADITRLQGVGGFRCRRVVVDRPAAPAVNNSWMHNLPALAGGTSHCALQIHPDDAARLGVTQTAVITGPAGKT